jgi:hypothetical protein
MAAFKLPVSIEDPTSRAAKEVAAVSAAVAWVAAAVADVAAAVED